jgi:Protein of unknown function (DUF2878)
VAAEVRLTGLALLLGGVFESLLVITQLAHYRSGMMHPLLAPLWMIIMWPLFATTMNASMAWLKKLAVAWVALIGALFAPLAYFAGARLGAVGFDNTVISLTVIAAGWAVLLPVLVSYARTHNGFTNLNLSSVSHGWGLR